MKITKFNAAEVPYGTLARFGLTPEMIEDLPKQVTDDILDGRRSPVLPISITDNQGEQVCTRTRFALVRLNDGNVDVLFYPQVKVCPLDNYTPEERKALLANRAIIATMTTAEGKKVQAFHQIDVGTNQILSVPTPVIGRNLELVANEVQLTNAELTCLQKGMPITIMDGDALHTVGIDLNEKSGIRIADGDEKRWREEQRKAFGQYNFGINGCWVADNDGNLDYVPEESYTEEMWEEMKKRNNTVQIKH